MSEPTVRVFDTGPLSAFAKAGVLGVLKILRAEFECMVPAEVLTEVRNGVGSIPALTQIVDCGWLTEVTLKSQSEIESFTEVSKRLIGHSGRNLGETAAIGWARAHPGAQVVVDDGAARAAARDYGLPVIGSVGILIQGVRDSAMSEAMADSVADELLLVGGSRLPFGPGGFVHYARAQGAL